MTTVEVRTQTRELLRVIAEKEDHEVLALNVRSLKNLVELMRDYAIITHASAPESEIAAAVEKLIDYVDLNARSADEPVMSASYKTTYLAEVFNVSVTAINNWIDEGRFVGYQRQPHKHARMQPEMYVPSWKLFGLHSGYPGNCPNLYIYNKPLPVERLFTF
ncbi:hypothetical protein ACE41H_21630 [Paenibacillus enshidis]|uniref:DNA-binding protein n=1 Tax=Paenibacillus enshidis TaxID=1458439 RepID=A0ABV5B146_9BACL